VIRLHSQRCLHRVVPRPLDVEGATERIQALLAERAVFGWRRSWGRVPDRGRPSRFIALLSSRARRLHVHQEGRSPIQIRRESPREAREAPCSRRATAHGRRAADARSVRGATAVRAALAELRDAFATGDHASS